MMQEKYLISVIIPFYNASKYIKNCLSSLLSQDFEDSYEIIMINDASIDNSQKIIENYNLKNLKIYNLEINSGPAKARNIGLQFAKGKYISFLDVDDTLEKQFLSSLYYHAVQGNNDFVFCDTKWIENSQHKRKSTFMYDNDKKIEGHELKDLLKERFLNLKSKGLLDCKGKLIKRSILEKNNIKFDDKLRYLEDEIFLWDLYPFVNRVQYIRKKLYCYYVHPNQSSAVVQGLNLGFPIEKFKIISKHIKKSFLNLKCKEEQAINQGNQAYIFFIINVLISYSKSIVQGKVEKTIGLENRRKIIMSIYNDKDTIEAIKTYKRSKGENILIPLAISFKSILLLEIACTKRARYILKTRSTNKKSY